MRTTAILTAALFLLLSFSSCNQKEGAVLRIATASNMQYAMDSLARSYSRKTGIRVESIVSSSGKLSAQIQEGAPFDLFVAADMEYPQKLFKQGHTSAAPAVYARGKLVLWSARSEIPPNLEWLVSDSVTAIAVANPELAPYGRAAIQSLSQHGLYERIKDKLVYGESISQVNQFIATGAVSAGFTSKSTVIARNEEVSGHWWEIPAAYYSPITQGVVGLTAGNSERTNAFISYLFSAEAAEILEDFGYSKDE